MAGQQPYHLSNSTGQLAAYADSWAINDGTASPFAAQSKHADWPPAPSKQFAYK